MINSNALENVERFVRYFKTEIQIISVANLGCNAMKYRCLLLCCLIDTISNVIVTPADDGTKNSLQDADKEKFMIAVEKFGNWPDCTRVCRPYLEKLLKLDATPVFEPVRQFVAALPSWPDRYQSVVAVAKVDPAFSELASVWPKTANGRLLKINETPPKSLQHHELLYVCRNKLTHEMRDLIPESEDSLGHAHPYYHRTSDWNGVYWQFYQPPGFLARMAEDILNGLKDYCLERNVEPFSRLSLDRRWYERPC